MTDLWALTRDAYCQHMIDTSDYRDLYVAEPDARAMADTINAQHWEVVLRDRALEGRIPDDVLDDYVARYGLPALLRTFRGVAAPGIEGYLPPDVRAQTPYLLPVAHAPEAWERTWDEQRARLFAGVTRWISPLEYRAAKQEHKSIIIIAMTQGKTIPPRVLADYPDLTTP